MKNLYAKSRPAQPDLTTASGFMEAIFGSAYKATERPCITRQLPDGRAPAYPWPDRALSGHTHFSVGLFEYNTPRIALDGYRRRFDRCTGAMALLLDDVFEKCEPPKLQPTIRIETKKGSEQWLYVFKEPMRDLDGMAQMMETLAKAGHADEGGSTGKTSAIRLGRLPNSDPKGRGTAARVVWSDMNRLFVPDPELLFGPKGFNLKLRAKRTLTTHEGGVTLLNPNADPLLQWLSLNGHTRSGGGQTGQGWAGIICPWVHNHSNGAITGTDYHVATPRGFNCYHTSCKNKKPIDFLNHYANLGAPLDAGDSTGNAVDALAYRLDDPHLSAAWHAREYSADALALRMAATAMAAPDMRDILVDYTDTAKIQANVIATHYADRFKQYSNAQTIDDERAKRLNFPLEAGEQ